MIAGDLFVDNEFSGLSPGPMRKVTRAAGSLQHVSDRQIILPAESSFSLNKPREYLLYEKVGGSFFCLFLARSLSESTLDFSVSLLDRLASAMMDRRLYFV
jgi:hypothetical protein